MQVNEKDVILCDVDDTLIKWCEPAQPMYIEWGVHGPIPGPMSEQRGIKLDFYGTPKYVEEIKVHTEFLKSLKARGYYIRVHSGNGAKWAAQVVEALGLKDYVDSVETKPAKVIDDKPNENWMPQPIYLVDKK